jgi:hypothetical protein
MARICLTNRSLSLRAAFNLSYSGLTTVSIGKQGASGGMGAGVYTPK